MLLDLKYTLHAIHQTKPLSSHNNVLSVPKLKAQVKKSCGSMFDPYFMIVISKNLAYFSPICTVIINNKKTNIITGPTKEKGSMYIKSLILKVGKPRTVLILIKNNTEDASPNKIHIVV
jgi:hypothetical protein